MNMQMSELMNVIASQFSMYFVYTFLNMYIRAWSPIANTLMYYAFTQSGYQASVTFSVAENMEFSSFCEQNTITWKIVRR